MAKTRFSGPVYSDNGWISGTADSLVALAGGGQSGATALQKQFNRFTTVATAGDSALLPVSITGQTIIVTNSGTKNLAMFPSASETINGGAAAASITIPPGSTYTFQCITAGSWFADAGTSDIFSNLILSGTFTYTPQVLAAVGSTQLGAGAITSSRVVVTVTASTEGVRLPTAATGLEVQVFMPGTVGVKVYPGTNARLDTTATNVAVVLAAGKANIYFARDTTRWMTMKGA